jgi:hypothetical protein
MAPWVKCTFKSNRQPVYINLGTASTLAWNEQQQTTYVTFPGEDESVQVLEKPEAILQGRDR